MACPENNGIKKAIVNPLHMIKNIEERTRMIRKDKKDNLFERPN